MKRKWLKLRYRSLYEKIAQILRRDDPIGMGDGLPEDEYEPEAGTILPRLKTAASQADVCRIIHEEFVHWFGATTAGPESTYEQIAAEIWNTLNKN